MSRSLLGRTLTSVRSLWSTPEEFDRSMAALMTTRFSARRDYHATVGSELTAIGVRIAGFRAAWTWSSLPGVMEYGLPVYEESSKKWTFHGCESDDSDEFDPVDLAIEEQKIEARRLGIPDGFIIDFESKRVVIVEADFSSRGGPEKWAILWDEFCTEWEVAIVTIGENGMAHVYDDGTMSCAYFARITGRSIHDVRDEMERMLAPTDAEALDALETHARLVTGPTTDRDAP